MRKILRGLVVVFLLFFVSPSFVRADETSETTGGSTETPQQVLEIAPGPSRVVQEKQMIPIWFQQLLI